jgi:outer membrane protein OmpA-like peptidoglycan-associated protein
MNHHHGWNVDPTFCACADSVIHERTGLWEHARFEYTAKGGEQYITLGNFADNHTTKTYSIQHRPAQEEMLSKASYYYLDDVVVKLKFDPSDVIPGKEIFSEDEVELNRPYVLKNILFQFNSHKLLTRSFEELDQVVSILQKNTNYNVEVNGYTDDIGGDSYNMHLSKKRADTVREYLIHYGVNPDRIKATGYGKRFPVVEGVSEDARRLNRRVEIRFTL